MSGSWAPSLCALLLLGSAAGVAWADARAGAPAWASDQTQQMPYTCRITLWVDPLLGARWYNGGDGSKAHPYRLPQDLNGSGSAVLGPGTCVNLINDAVIVDQWTMTPAQHGEANTPLGYVVLRSTDAHGDPVPAVDASGRVNRRPPGQGGPARWKACCNFSAAALNMDRSDFLILDGIDWTVEAAGQVQAGGPCISAGQSNLGPNSTGPSHLIVRNNYVHGCGGGGVMAAAVDFFIVQNNVCEGAATSSPYQESCFSSYQARSARTARPTGVDRFLAYHQVFSDNVGRDAYEAAVAPGARTDGNCLIIDDNLNSQNHGVGAGQTNAGPFPFRSLVARNRLFHCGGKGVQIFQSQHVDVVHNIVGRNNFDAGNPGTYRGEISTNQALDVEVQDNRTFSVGAITTMRRPASGPSLEVDDVSSYLYSTAGAAPSMASPIKVTLEGSPHLVVGVAADRVNVSTTPGGVSGVLVFSAPIGAQKGKPGDRIAPAAPSVVAASYNSALFDGDGASSISTCQPWSKTCSGEGRLDLITTSSSVHWRRNAAETMNGAAIAFASGSASPSPPTAGDRADADPASRAAATLDLRVDPAFVLKDMVLVQPGKGCSVDDRLALRGGRSEEEAVIVVDALSGSGVAAFHLETAGRYGAAMNATLLGVSSSGRCAGASFSARSYLQLLQTSPRP